MLNLQLVSKREGIGQNMGLICLTVSHHSFHRNTLLCSGHVCFRSVVTLCIFLVRPDHLTLSPVRHIPTGCSAFSVFHSVRNNLCPALLWSHARPFNPVTQYIKLCKALQMCIIKKDIERLGFLKKLK